MFEKIRKMKNQKGFTLVELIVVLVILAILAAMLVPALTGYIDKANNQKIVATTRQVVMAAQTEVSEAYASKTFATSDTTIKIEPAGSDEANTVVTGASIVKLAEVGDYDSSSKQFTLKNSISKIEITYDAKGNVKKVALTQGKKTCTYEKGGANAAGGYDYTSGDYGVKNS